MRRLLLTGLSGELEARLRALLGRDCTIHSCARVVEAARRLRQEAVDVLVANIDAPAGECHSILAELRAARPGVRDILLVPRRTPQDVLTALRASVFACFGAPHDPGEVADMVRRALDAADWRDGIEVLSAKPDWLALKVSCRLVDADRLVHFMKELRGDVDEDQRTGLVQAFREVLLNAMEHGAGFDPEKVIYVSAVRTTRAILFHFRDPGIGFCLDDLPHAALSNPPGDPCVHVAQREARGMRPGGFGLLLAMRIADELLFNERGNEVLLIKRLN